MQPGTQLKQTDFSKIVAGQIKSGNYLLGFDINNAGQLSKMDSNLVLTDLETGGGGGGLISITYANLMVAIAGSTLIPGNLYLITDFATKHYIVDSDGTQYVGSIITGTTEQLIATAVSVNAIDKNVLSVSFPQDTISYDPEPTNWLTDLSFSDTGVIITGFKGVITKRTDTQTNVTAFYDFRSCKFRRWKTDTTAWSAGNFPKGSIVNHLGFIYIDVKNAIAANVPGTATNIWVQLLDIITDTEYFCDNPTSTNGITSSVDFDDFLTFVDNNTGTYLTAVSGTEIGPGFIFGYRETILPNVVFFLNDAPTPQIFLNTISGGFVNNTIISNFNLNNLGFQFAGNVISNDFIENTINVNFIGNTISYLFRRNNILSDFSNN